MKLSLEDRAYGLYVDGKPVAVESAETSADGINVTVTFRTTLGALDGRTTPQQERTFGGFREHEHVAVRFDPKWPPGGMVQIISARPPSDGESEAIFTVRALGTVFNGGKPFLAPGQVGEIGYSRVEKHEIGVSSNAN